MIDNDDTTFYLSSKIPTPYPWVQIELVDKKEIKHIKITNRPDCCGERLAKIEVRVGDYEVSNFGRSAFSNNELCARYNGPAQDGEIVRITCHRPISGKYITIQALGWSSVYMNIAEVEILKNVPGKLMRVFNLLSYEVILRNVHSWNFNYPRLLIFTC